jgi:farnesol dehydrogenase
MSMYLVTGACGFIGTRLIESLVGRGERVRALSRRPEVRPASPPGFDWNEGGPLASPLVEWVRGDITDPEGLSRAMEGCTHVFHLAAYAKNFAPDPAIYTRMNVEGMHNVFDAAQKAGVKRIVWTSSCVTLGPSNPGEVIDEATPRRTDRYFTEYERTKSIAEREAIQRAGQGLPVVIVNPTRVYGPGPLTEGNSVSLLIDRYDRGRAPFLPNFGLNVGNWVLVDDVVQGQLLAMERGRIGERYILGGENATLGKLYVLIDDVSGKRHFKVPLYRFWPMLIAHAQLKMAQWFGRYPEITPDWMRTFLADWAHSSEKAQRELGYQPTPLVEGLQTTYEWLQRVRKEKHARK